MILQLDVRTILFANFAYSAVVMVFLAVFSVAGHRRIAGLTWWTAGFLMVSLNFLLLALRDGIPLTLSLLLPHALAVLGFLLVKEGIARFYRIRRRLWGDAVLVVLVIAALLLTARRGLHFRLAIVVLSALSAILLTLLMIRKGRTSRALRLFYYVSVAAQLIRLWLGLSIPSGTKPMEAGTSLVLISMLFFVSQMTIALGLVFISVQRLIAEQDKLMEKTRELSLYDELTGLLNRRGFQAVYQVEERRIIRHNLPVSLAVADLDRFKSVNDSYGHDVGDKVLRTVAETIKDELRGGDVVARWGGEEFLIFQPETDDTACRASLERVRRKVETLTIDGGFREFGVTISFGFYTVLSGTMDFDTILKYADDNLYRAKNQGRNRIIGDSEI